MQSSTVTPASSDNTCFVCLELCENKSPCPCNSYIHEKCFYEYLSKVKKNICPYCKKKYSKNLLGETTKREIKVFIQPIISHVVEPEMNTFTQITYHLKVIFQYLVYTLFIIVIIPTIIGFIIMAILLAFDIKEKDFYDITMYIMSWFIGILCLFGIRCCCGDIKCIKRLNI